MEKQIIVRVDEIKIPEIRLNSIFDPEAEKDFRASVGKDGIFQPPILVQDVETGAYWLLDGRNRLEAWKDYGRSHIKAIVRQGRLIDAIIGSAKTNIHRGRYDPASLATVVRHLHRDLGWTVEKIANELSYSKARISDLLKVSEDSEVLEKLRNGEISLKEAVSMSRKKEISPKEGEIEEIGSPGELISENLPSFEERGEKQAFQKGEPLPEGARVIRTEEELRDWIENAPTVTISATEESECPCGCGWKIRIDWEARSIEWIEP